MCFRSKILLLCAILWIQHSLLLAQEKKNLFPADASQVLTERVESNLSGALIGTPAPQFSAQSMDGQEFGPKELLGKVIVLNFWFIACPPCKYEKPIWNEVVQAYAQDERVLFLSISRDQDIEAIKAYLQSQKIDMPVVADGSALVEQFGVTAFPTTLIIDRRGRYSAGVVGAIHKETVQKLIQHALLGKKPNPKHMINPHLDMFQNDPFQSTSESVHGNPSALSGTTIGAGEQVSNPPMPSNEFFNAMEESGQVQSFNFGEGGTVIKDEEGNTYNFFEMLSMTGSGAYIQEDKTDPDGKSYVLLRKASPTETAQIREQNKLAYQNAAPIIEKLNQSFDQELNKNLPKVTPDIPIRIKEGPQISFADYQQKMKSGKWFEQGILAADGQLTGVEIQKRPDEGKLSDRNKGILKDLRSVIGKTIEPFELTDLEGNVIRSQDTPGRVWVFNFWFTTCKPCIAEFPALNKVYQRYKNDPRVVFAAITFENREKVEAFVERGKYPLDFPIVPENYRLLRQFKNPGAPGNVVVGTDGQILYNACGTNKLLVEEQLCTAIDNALAQKDPKTHGQIGVGSQLFSLQQWTDYKKQKPLKQIL